MPATPFTDQVAVITGAASGIGEALARALAAQGARLALCDVHTERLAAVVAELEANGIECLVARVDVADAAAVQAFAESVRVRFGRADLVFNNAGVSVVAGVEALPLADAHWLMNINFWGVVHGCQSFLPLMRANGRGTLVNISSIFAMVSMPGQSLYNASKAAVRGFSDALREELFGTGIRVLCVHPGGVRTRIAEDARLKDLRLVADSPASLKRNFKAVARTSPQAAAQTILAAVVAGRPRVLVGTDAWLLDWLFRLFPTRVSPWASALGRWQRRRTEHSRLPAARPPTR